MNYIWKLPMGGEDDQEMISGMRKGREMLLPGNETVKGQGFYRMREEQ